MREQVRKHIVLAPRQPRKCRHKLFISHCRQSISIAHASLHITTIFVLHNRPQSRFQPRNAFQLIMVIKRVNRPKPRAATLNNSANASPNAIVSPETCQLNKQTNPIAQNKADDLLMLLRPSTPQPRHSRSAASANRTHNLLPPRFKSRQRFLSGCSKITCRTARPGVALILLSRCRSLPRERATPRHRS